MKKGTAFLIGLASFASGFAIGVLLSPAKRGFGNNNGNVSYHYYGDKWLENSGKEHQCCTDDGCRTDDVTDEECCGASEGE